MLKKLDKKTTIIHVHGWTKALSSSIFDIAFKMNFKVVLTLHDYFAACPNGGYFNYQKNEICKLKPMSIKCIKCNCDSRNYIFKIYRVIRQFVQNKIVKLNKKIENVITISELSEKILKETLGKNTQITRIYNPIDLDENIEKIDPTRNKYFLYVGRISKEKGVDCCFKGRVPYDEMCALIDSCDIVVNPITGGAAASIINKHADYAACGHPVVNSQEANEYRKLVEEYDMGLNCENGDAIDLATKLEALIEDKDLRCRMGMNARKCAEEKFNRKKTYVKIEKVILGEKLSESEL